MPLLGLAGASKDGSLFRTAVLPLWMWLQQSFYGIMGVVQDRTALVPLIILGWLLWGLCLQTV